MKKAFTLIELLVTITILSILAALAIGGLASGIQSGDGIRAGIITKFGLYKGMIYSTYEGEMISGLVNKNSNIGGTAYQFSGPKHLDPEIVEKVNRAIETGHRVKIEYKRVFASPSLGNSGYVITNITDLEE